MAKKKEIKNIEELLKEALIPKEEHPYEIPSNWEWVRLKNIGLVQTGTTPSTSNLEFYGGEYPFYKPTDLEQGYYTEYASSTLSEEGLEKTRIVPEKSIMVTCIGATIGKTGFSRKLGATNQQINTIVPNISTKNEYGYFYIISPDFQQMIMDNYSSTTLPILNKSKFENLCFPLPPLSEQTRIVYKLESMLSKLKEAKEKIAEAKESFELRRASILHKAFTGELTKQWREENVSSKVSANDFINLMIEKKQNMILNKEIQKPRGNNTINENEVNDLKTIPNTWSLAKIIDLCFVTKLAGFEFTEYMKYTDTGEIIAIRGLNLKEGKLNLDDVQKIKREVSDLLPRSKVSKGDLLCSYAGTVGALAIVDEDNKYHLAPNVAKIMPFISYDGLFSKYLLYYLMSTVGKKELNKYSKSTAQASISMEAIRDTIVPLPPQPEQQEIVARIEALLKAEDEAKDLLNMEEQIDLLEKSILSKAFRGELGTNDLSDEPALELLKRVLGE